jgi:hypothetical protein
MDTRVRPNIYLCEIKILKKDQKVLLFVLLAGIYV